MNKQRITLDDWRRTGLRRGGVPLAVGLLLVVSLTGVAAEPGAGTRHGEFTGEVKPVIYVSDVARSAAFYRDVLGFGFDGFAGEPNDPYYAEMLAASLKFGLHEPTKSGDPELVGRLRLYFRVRNIEAQRAFVARAGGHPGEILRRDWMDFFSVKDPDGNDIVFAETDPARHTSQPWAAPEQPRQ